jgi:hypothetical protein
MKRGEQTDTHGGRCEDDAPINIDFLRVRFPQRDLRRHVPEAPRVARQLVRLALVLSPPDARAQAEVEEFEDATGREPHVIGLQGQGGGQGEVRVLESMHI